MPTHRIHHRSVHPIWPILLCGLIFGCQPTPSSRSLQSTSETTSPADAASEASTGSLPTSKATGTTYRRGAVAADSTVASDAGVEMLKLGGNAVDAAVATGFTLCVSRPYSCGLGGGGFLLVFDPKTGERHCLDFRECAPKATHPDYFVEVPETASGYDPSLYGGRAVGVPGQIPGLLEVHDRFGTLPLATVLEPAIRAARTGVSIDAHYLGMIDGLARLRRRHPDLRPASNWIWKTLCLHGDASIGDLVVQDALGDYLARIADQGIDAWYGVADLVAGVDRAWDGDLTAEELRSYRPKWRDPLFVSGVYDDVDAILMPPPSSGGIALAQIMTLVDQSSAAFGDPTPDDAAYGELLVAAFRHAFADRARHLADPDFAPIPVADLLDARRLEEVAASIQPGEVVPAQNCGILPGGLRTSPPDDRGTSHFSVIDARGMTVACTQTINGAFGSLVAVPEIGVVLNNEMNDFTTIPGSANLFGLTQSDRNAPEPGKRPLSSMSPTILVRDGRTVATAGASGGPRIITGVAQVLLRYLAASEDPWPAIAAPRVHHQWSPSTLRYEDGAEPWNPRFEQLEFDLVEIPSVGVVQAIFVDGEGLKPASDPRKGGTASGW